jgi:hypothetical protein
MRSVWVLGFLVVAGCSKSAEEAGEKAAGEYVAKSAKGDIEELKKAIASPDPGSAKFKCAHMANIDTLEKADKAVADELRTLCTKDLYLAMMKVEVEKVEAARKAKPEPDALLTECYNAMFDFSKDEMTKAKTIDLAKDLIARFEAACPPKK